MKIGELAAITDTPVETIRFYEREGLLPAPRRSESNYRIYDDGHARRLQFVRQCRSLDMALDEVRVLLGFKDAPQRNCLEVNQLLDAHIGHVAQRIRELRTLEKLLKVLRSQCLNAEAAADCGILNELDEASRAAVTDTLRPGHIDGSHGLPRSTSRRA